jgi:hypothetical protein
MLKAYSIGEKAKAATSTPLPKAIMVAIIDLGSLANNATTEPKRRGTLATKPHTKACNTVFVTNSFTFLLLFHYIFCQIIIILLFFLTPSYFNTTYLTHLTYTIYKFFLIYFFEPFS